jgi:hypothetical protein
MSACPSTASIWSGQHKIGTQTFYKDLCAAAKETHDTLLHNRNSHGKSGNRNQTAISARVNKLNSQPVNVTQRSTIDVAWNIFNFRRNDNVGYQLAWNMASSKEVKCSNMAEHGVGLRDSVAGKWFALGLEACHHPNRGGRLHLYIVKVTPCSTNYENNALPWVSSDDISPNLLPIVDLPIFECAYLRFSLTAPLMHSLCLFWLLFAQ